MSAAGHEWLLSVVMYTDLRDVERLAAGQRVVFRKVDVLDADRVRGSAAFCGRCQLTYQQMTGAERERCRG